MIDIHLLEQLNAFAECGTLSAAAEKLHTSQPALTRSMKKLEEELGLTLFERRKNRLELNAVGLQAAEYAKNVLHAGMEFEENLHAYARSIRTIRIGFCAPVPQQVLTPIINTVYEGMTISADMSDDTEFLARVRSREYDLAVVHEKPEGEDLFAKKCGHEDLYISLLPGDPLTFYPEIHLQDLDERSILLLSSIGFWSKIHRDKTPNATYLLQIDAASFEELINNSGYPNYSSSFFVRRGEIVPGKVTVPLADPECHADYYLVCLQSERHKYRSLFSMVDDQTIL